MRKVLKVLSYFFIFVAILVIIANLWVIQSTQGKTFNSIDSLPANEVGLVLGTSNKTSKGETNPFFYERIETAYKLYKQGKVKHILVSGDNRSIYYNEPQMMKRALEAKGVPSTAITLDYAGLRTLDSIVRCKEIFGQQRVTIITQPFHSYRALFISKYYAMDAVAMEAKEPSFGATPGVRLREYGARFVAVMDLYVLGTTPRFMGQKEDVNIAD